MVLNSYGTWFAIVRPYSAYPILKILRAMPDHAYKQLLLSRKIENKVMLMQSLPPGLDEGQDNNYGS